MIVLKGCDSYLAVLQIYNLPTLISYIVKQQAPLAII